MLHLICTSLIRKKKTQKPITNRAFQAGFETEPVMCQTVDLTWDKNYCPWASCGEWCLTKQSGFCPQIMATTRRNGTDIQLENCTRVVTTSCPQVNKITVFSFSFSFFFGFDFVTYKNRNQTWKNVGK